MGRNSTILGEMAKEVLEGKPMIVGGVELFVSMVCLDDCQYSIDDDRIDDGGGGSNSGTNTSDVFLGIMLVLILVVVILIIVIVYIKLKKEIKKKKNNKK